MITSDTCPSLFQNPPAITDRVVLPTLICRPQLGPATLSNKSKGKRPLPASQVGTFVGAHLTWRDGELMEILRDNALQRLAQLRAHTHALHPRNAQAEHF